ncbi:penicillin-binding protein [Aureimonas sp. Leaf454]|uniref:D-alanyl-D-alanine carboxypeptidase family protein n=1 Tax=Aureimonas sp. Leaf454 TaxID=1736381 RepID=UPI0006FEF02E|nr:D-alanyl-D-alanine carboxypeptidase family protein [Aureimonas sp. Leaf454]KQT49029.1 penicillin-binding protein [Aureimonas sp. Leaf454]
MKSLGQRATAAGRAGASALAILCVTWPAYAFETAATAAILTDVATGTVLFEKNADEAHPPASLAKLMTVAVLFDRLKAGKLKLEDEFPVSEKAWREGGANSGGSTMFLPLNSSVSVADLIKGIIIQSGNDATIVVAEGIAGSVPVFADMMNAEAKKIGLTGSHFTNPHGLPDPDQHVTMRDLDKLAAYLIETYPDQYPLFSEEEFHFNGILQRNRNPLLSLGADGLKTGHTQASGYALVASAKSDQRRIILAITGLTSMKARAEAARELMTYGLNGFEDLVLMTAGKSLGEVSVTDGAVPSVTAVSTGEVRILAARGTEGSYQQAVALDPSVTAPVAAGARLGSIRFTKDGVLLREEPVVAKAAVEEASMMQWVTSVVTGWFG